MNKMRKKQEKKNTITLVILLLALIVGVGYAVLNELLTINTSIKYDTINWDVGFASVENGGGTVTATTSISEDKKTITISCDLGMSTDSETCIAIAKITNNSTFNIKLNENPTIDYDDDYISSVQVVWTSDSTTVKAADTMGINETKEIKLTITTKELSSSLLPTESLEIPVTVTMNWVEDGEETNSTPESGENTDEGSGEGEDEGSNSESTETVTNLFNLDEVESGGVYHADTGAWTAVSSYSSTGFIPVEQGTTYYIYSTNLPQSHITFYDENKTFKRGRYQAVENGQIIILPSYIGGDTVYMKVGIPNTQLSSLVISTTSQVS